MSKEYDALVAAELESLIVLIKDLLQRHDSYNQHGMAAVLMCAAVMLKEWTGVNPGIQESKVSDECIRLLNAYPHSTQFLFSQLSKLFELSHLGVIKGKDQS